MVVKEITILEFTCNLCGRSRTVHSKKEMDTVIGDWVLLIGYNIHICSSCCSQYVTVNWGCFKPLKDCDIKDEE